MIYHKIVIFGAIKIILAYSLDEFQHYFHLNFYSEMIKFSCFEIYQRIGRIVHATNHFEWQRGLFLFHPVNKNEIQT